MKRLIGMGLLVLMIGCKGPQGPQGPQGPTGLLVDGVLVHLAGPVTGNDMFVDVPGLNIERGDVVNVYVCNGQSTNQCNPVPSYSGNVTYRINEMPNKTIIELVGFQTVGNFYYIDALEKN